MAYNAGQKPMICVIAPYPKLKEIADSLAPSIPVPIQTVVGDLGDGLAAAREALADEAIIVSRGGTAKLIRETLGAEVMEIGVSPFDLLRILKPQIGVLEPVAVAGFRSITDHAEAICSILGIPAIILPVDDESEIPERIGRIRGMRLSLLVGDMVAVRSASELGVPVALIESGPDAVRDALEKAAAISRSIMFRQESDLRLGAVLNSVRDAIVAVDRDGRISHINRTARKLLGESAVPGAAAASILPGGDIARAMDERREVSGTLLEAGGKRAALEVTPIVSRESVEGAVVVLQEVGKLQEMEKKVRRQLHEKGLVAKYSFSDISSRSPRMRACLDVAVQYAKSSGAILIYGETGTGKERLAQSIHNAGTVRDGPFVAVNCGALPPTLLESELFGYEEGAFTGAAKGGKAGLFELAHGGTIFLDEINELDVALQGKLLRVLQEREVMRVGGSRVVPVAFRLIAASNVPLADEMARGRLRGDLFYRLNVLDIRIPPLRERVEDIEPLFLSFAAQAARRDGASVPVPPAAWFFDALRERPWPGNVRELENVAEKWSVLRRLLDAPEAMRLTLESAVTADAGEPGTVSGGQSSTSGAPAASTGPGGVGQPHDSAFAGSLDDIIARAARSVLDQEGGNLSRTARRLGIDRQTLRKRLGS